MNTPIVLNFFAVAAPVTTNADLLWIRIPSNGDAVTDTLTLKAIKTPVSSMNTLAFDVRDGIITAFGGSSNYPQRIHSIPFNGRTATAIGPEMTSLFDSSFVRVGDLLAWLSWNNLMACSIASGCATPRNIVGSVAGAIWADAQNIDFNQTENATSHARACPVADVLAGSCSPATLGVGFYWHAVRQIHADANYVYGIVQSRTKLVRSTR
jgi:hypothetical protein